MTKIRHGGVSYTTLDSRYYTQIRLNSTTAPSGASLIGVADAGGFFASTNVETVLQEIVGVILPGEYLRLDGTNIPTANYNWTTNLTTTGTLQGGTITDGTATLTGGAWTGATYNGLTITTGANTFTLTRGATDLIVSADCTINQDLSTTSSPTFNVLTATTINCSDWNDVTGAINLLNWNGVWIISSQSILPGAPLGLGTAGSPWSTIYGTNIYAATSVNASTLTIAGGSITDTTGAISFGNENLTTTGTVQAEQLTSTDDITMAGYLLNTMGVGDTNGMFNNQANYTGAGSVIVFRNYGRHNGAPSASGRNVTGMFNQAVNNHAVNGAPFGVTQETIGTFNDVDVFGSAAHTATAMVAFEERTTGLLNEVSDGAGRTLSQTAPSNFINYIGMENTVRVENSVDYNNGAGSVTVNAYGALNNVTNRFQATAGTVTVNTYGDHITVLGNASGTSTAYGLYIAGVSGADNNYAIWDASGANWILDGDNQKIILGEGQDGSFYWTTEGDDHLKLDPQEAAVGHYIVLNVPKTTTGDPPNPVEGLIYWNTFDNVCKIYADGGYRTLASW